MFRCGDRENFFQRIFSNIRNNNENTYTPVPALYADDTEGEAGLTRTTLENLMLEISGIDNEGFPPDQLRTLMQMVLKASPLQRKLIAQAIETRQTQRPAGHGHGERSKGTEQLAAIARICPLCKQLEIKVAQPATLVAISVVNIIRNLPIWLHNGAVEISGSERTDELLKETWDKLAVLLPRDSAAVAGAFRDSYHSDDIARLLPALDNDTKAQLDRMFGLTPAISALNRLLLSGSATEIEMKQYYEDKQGVATTFHSNPSDVTGPSVSFGQYFIDIANDFINASWKATRLPYFATKGSPSLDLDDRRYRRKFIQYQGHVFHKIIHSIVKYTVRGMSPTERSDVQKFCMRPDVEKLWDKNHKSFAHKNVVTLMLLSIVSSECRLVKESPRGA